MCTGVQWALVSALLLAACDPDPEPAGPPAPTGPSIEALYRVLRHTYNSNGCTDEGVVLTGGFGHDPYFRLVQESSTTLDYHSCESATVCEDLPDVGKSTLKRDGVRWQNEWSNTSYSGGSCDLHRTNWTATPSDGVTEVRMEGREFYHSLTLAQPDCTQGLLETHRGTMRCTRLEVVRAERVP